MLSLIDYRDELQPVFSRLNKAWLEEYFVVEPIDEWVLEHPQEAILDHGGKIFFAELDGQVVGTVALKYEGPGVYEMTKMAVDQSHRGLGAGKFLCSTAIEQARLVGADRLILYSNRRLANAIGIYLKAGFKEIPLQQGLYGRADIMMELSLHKNTGALNFDPAKEYVLEDDRVLLRPIQADDLQFLLPFALNEPDTWKYSYISAKGEEGMRAYVQSAGQSRLTGKEYTFIVYDKKLGEYAGCTRFYDIQTAYQTVQLGYTWYGVKFRGSGLNKHCKYLLLQFAFETLQAVRVEFRADANNQRSIAAMKSIGCTIEGILRSNMPLTDGGRRDSIVLSILNHEWEQTVKQSLKQKLTAYAT